MVGRVEEAGDRSGVASRPRGIYVEQNRVEVAVKTHLHHAHRVAGRRALFPESSFAGVEPCVTRLPRLAPRLLVKVGDHQDLSGVRVLNHRWDESFREVRVHCLTSRPMAARSRLTSEIESSPK